MRNSDPAQGRVFAQDAKKENRMFTHYQRIWQFNVVVVWPLLWLAYVLQHGLNAVSAVAGFLVGLILLAT